MASLLLGLACFLSLLFGPVVFGYYSTLLRSPAAVFFSSALLAFLVLCVTVSLFEGIRGIRQRRIGGVVAVTCSVLWLLLCLLFLILKLEGGW
ncbi:MAG: hypothetical protein FJ109_05435 [Deltaproteobacteria bacterium]|nr:hypothetical protein [Deltaproteobacteria bacterium]